MFTALVVTRLLVDARPAHPPAGPTRLLGLEVGGRFRAWIADRRPEPARATAGAGWPAPPWPWPSPSPASSPRASTTGWSSRAAGCSSTTPPGPPTSTPSAERWPAPASPGPSCRSRATATSPSAPPSSPPARSSAGPGRGRGGRRARPTVVRDEFVGPTIGNELRRKALIALGLALAAQLVYLAVRFRWTYGPAAVAAMFHDVVLLLGVFAWLGKTLDGVFLAALLTVIGYSINDSVVVFDRIRELRRHRHQGAAARGGQRRLPPDRPPDHQHRPRRPVHPRRPLPARRRDPAPTSPSPCSSASSWVPTPRCSPPRPWPCALEGGIAGGGHGTTDRRQPAGRTARRRNSRGCRSRPHPPADRRRQRHVLARHARRSEVASDEPAPTRDHPPTHRELTSPSRSCPASAAATTACGRGRCGQRRHPPQRAPRPLRHRHRQGRRPAAAVTLTDDQARRLGAILAGAYFKPAVVEEIEAVVGGLLIDWVTAAPTTRPAPAGPSPSSRSAGAPA